MGALGDGMGAEQRSLFDAPEPERTEPNRLTYRQRRERKAARLREWAEKREAKAEASFGRAHEIADMIPFGQPILVGHHSEGRHRRDLAGFTLG